MPDQVGHDGDRDEADRADRRGFPIDVGNDGDGVLQETADERFIVSTNFMYICRLFGEMSRLSTSARHDKATQNYDQTQIHTRRDF